MIILAIFALILLFAGMSLQMWRWSDKRRASGLWRDLARTARNSTAVFEPAMVNDLPVPAQRFFQFTIQPGAPLRTVAEIRMTGMIGLGDKNKPNYLPMRARQILAPPHGLVWDLDAGRGLLRVTGSDGFDSKRSWTRFWLLKTLPVVRAGNDPDHARAAFGRVVAEAVFWAPAALLPQFGVNWEAVGDNAARATVSFKGMTQTVDVSVAEDGRPTKVVIPRWSNANPEKRYRLQPFGGYLSAFQTFAGYTLPTRVEGGNFIDSEAYFPFYQAEVEALRFLPTD